MVGRKASELATYLEDMQAGLDELAGELPGSYGGE